MHRDEPQAARDLGEINSEARQERLAHAFEISGDAALLIDRETLCVVDANEPACRLFGCALDELLLLQAQRNHRKRKYRSGTRGHLG